MVTKGIDLSYSNGVVDWNKIKDENIDFAIIRTGFGKESPNQIDKQFENNYKGAKSVGIPVGAYHYSYAVMPKEAEQEAEFCLKLLKDKQFEYPIFIDIEESRQVSLSSGTCCEIVKAFCDKLEKAGYWAGVYSFDSFFKSNLSSEIVKRYTTWVARVGGSKPVCCSRCDMWQYSWDGKVNGSGSLKTDMDECYRDFPTLIKQAKKNGYNVSVPKTYKVSAEISGLTLSQANILENALKEKGMTVNKTIE